MRLLARALVLSVTLVLVLPATALAGSGEGRVYIGPSNTGGSSNGYAAWSGGNNYYEVEAAAFGTSSGKCITTYFDWNVPSGHYDARSARTCANNYTRRSPVGEDWSEVSGMQKFGACYAYKNEVGSCANHPAADIAISGASVNASFPNYTTRVWVRNSDGSTWYHSGGDPRRADG